MRNHCTSDLTTPEKPKSPKKDGKKNEIPELEFENSSPKRNEAKIHPVVKKTSGKISDKIVSTDSRMASASGGRNSLTTERTN